VAVVPVMVGERFETVFFPVFSRWMDGWMEHSLTRSRIHSAYFVMEDGIILDK